jgi:hypothetical protein
VDHVAGDTPGIKPTGVGYDPPDKFTAEQSFLLPFSQKSLDFTLTGLWLRRVPTPGKVCIAHVHRMFLLLFARVNLKSGKRSQGTASALLSGT